jgi:hypothetical protein
VKYLIVLLAITGLYGCGSASPKQVSQFCHTSKTIEVGNGSAVASKTIVSCSDDPVERIVMKRTGIASDCGEYRYVMNLNGKPVERRNYACKKWDGTWEIVPTVSP